jgi:hypothetical protein
MAVPIRGFAIVIAIRGYGPTEWNVGQSSDDFVREGCLQPDTSPVLKLTARLSPAYVNHGIAFYTRLRNVAFDQFPIATGFA